MDSSTCVTPDCIATPAITEPVPLCILHALQVVSGALPQLLEAAAITLPDGQAALRGLVADKAKLLEVGSHDPVVYFIRNGDRVKIGTSRNLRQRVAALSLRAENVLLVVHGGAGVERTLHDEFADLRVGDTEWFRYEYPLVGFIRAKCAGALSDPMPDRSPRPSGIDGHDPRRDMVFTVIAEAGEDGIGPEGIIRRMVERFPGTEPPHAATIGRWMTTDARVWKPSYGRYAAASSSLGSPVT